MSVSRRYDVGITSVDTSVVSGRGAFVNRACAHNPDKEKARTSAALSALFDPGGDLTYMPLTMSVNKYVKTKDIDFIFATHQDPDIVSSFDKWLMYSDAKIVISKLWLFYLNTLSIHPKFHQMGNAKTMVQFLHEMIHHYSPRNILNVCLITIVQHTNQLLLAFYRLFHFHRH